MEMSHAYMRETAEALATQGFELAVQEHDYGTDAFAVPATRYQLCRESETFVLETVEHPDEGELYFLEIVEFHGMQSASFRLDSWKHRAHQVELKYQPTLDGSGGLSLILRLVSG